jgi:myo-inositol-1(or 4)-monophosphatase
MDDLALATLAATRAAEIIRPMFGRGVATELKGAIDPVTVADKLAESAILEVIAEHRPDDGILAEESGASGTGIGRQWIIDPLDGTVNFIHEVPHVAVSIGLWDGNTALVGVIVDVVRDDLYAATRGGGATLNGAPMHTSARTELAHMLVATGFPYDRNVRAATYAGWIAGVLPHVRGVRRMGSAALDFAYVAAGRYDAYFEHGLGPWDGAAGILLVEEAGGATVDLDGSPATFTSTDYIATSGAGRSELAEMIRRAAPAELRTATAKE